MDNNFSGEDNDNIDWDTEDELEIQEIPDATFSSCTNLRNVGHHTVSGHGEASSSSVPCQSKFIQQFIVMGFPEESIAKAIEQNGENEGLVLDALLTFKALEDSPEEQPSTSAQMEPSISSDDSSSQYNENFLDDFYEDDSWSSDSDNCMNSAKQSYLNDDNSSLSENENSLLFLANMGYPAEEASIAMERCGPEASFSELIDFMCAAQMAREEDVYLPEDEKPKLNSGGYKRKMYNELRVRKKQRAITDEEPIHLPRPMIGFGVPTESLPAIVQRTLPEQAIGPPFFYYENVALAPKGVWDTMSRFLYDIEPEFVDSKYFCATARKRGYIHNLPIEDRFPLLPLPPRTIHEAFPLTKKWWPSWDTRTKLNCLQTSIGSARLADRIRKAMKAMENFDDEPPLMVQKYVLDECRKWNLLWVGRNKVSPLETDEFEMLMGFPRNHTRGGGISRTDRYKSLGNAFQVDTVAYHLSVLKDLYPNGINVLSLFSGIGGAEVALYRLGIPLNNVVSVEISEVNRNILRSWWEQTNQKGNLIDFNDIQQLNGDDLEQMIDSFGGFDLVIGGSPCNNLTGSNRVTRDGLEGKDSSLFYDYVRIVDLVKSIMSNRRV